jgi:P4 family phage/plasmid primase-like protien
MQAPLAREYRTLKVGSVTELAEWLLGVRGDARNEDFGALAGCVFAAGRLWRCGPDCIWHALDEADVYQYVQHFDGARYVTPEGKTRCVQMSADLSRRVVRTIEAATNAPSFFSKAPNGLAFQNGFLRVMGDGGCRLETLTPQHHVTRALPFDYDAVPAPESFRHWKAFLTSCWGSSGPNGGPDVESISLLHQMIGYLLSGSNAHQKIFLLLGPPRCGKGTICKLLMRMFGPDAGAFKLAALDNGFALQGMLGKSVCIDGDVRRSRAVGRDEGKIVERLLGISAGDAQTIERKNLTALHLVLPTRLVIASNPPFGVRDVGSALASRIVTLPFSVSHLGVEDTDLEEKLVSELPAIVALAMQAVRTLRERGKFLEPSTAAEMREEIERGQNPLREFFEEWCVFGPESTTGCGELYRAMRQWAEENGNSAPSAQSFASALKQLGVRKTRPYSAKEAETGKRGNFVYSGVRLLEAPEGLAGSPRGLQGLKRPADGIATVTPLRGRQ